MGAVFRKELKLYMSGMFGYFVIALLLLSGTVAASARKTEES